MAMKGAPAGNPGAVGVHFRRYALANAMVLLAGVVSFPALTRLLDNTQYGILGYYETWVMMAVAVAKLGAQHAIIRLYPHDGDAARMLRFSTNLVLLPLIASCAIWLLLIAGLTAFAAAGELSLSPVLWCALISIPLQVAASLVQMVMRAGEHSRLLMAARIVARWLELACMLALVVLLERTALAAYGGRLLALVLIVAFYARWAMREMRFAREAVDFAEFRAALAYGMPLVANEIATVALISIDRVMLKGMLNDYAAVGIYSIGYSLGIQVSILMSMSISESFIPVANRLYETEGDAAVRALKSRILLPFTYAAVGVAVAIMCVGGDVIVALSGPDKAASGPVFAWIGSVYALYPLLEISGYGLLLHKRSRIVFQLTLVAAALNIGLNLFLIPMFGIMGAVYATVASYALLGASICVICPRSLLELPALRVLATAVLAAGLFLAGWKISGFAHWPSAWARLFAAGAMWLLLYVLPVLVLDRKLGREVVAWIRRRLDPPASTA